MNKTIKKLLSTFIAVILVFFSLQPIMAKDCSSYKFSDEVIISETTISLNNELTATIIITKNIVLSTRSTASTISASKHYIIRDTSGAELCRFTVTGDFTVNPGISATCTSASYSTSISDDAWEVDSASAYASGNQAIGSATFIKKILFITVDRESCDVTLTCDVNGNLS